MDFKMKVWRRKYKLKELIVKLDRNEAVVPEKGLNTFECFALSIL